MHQAAIDFLTPHGHGLHIVGYDIGGRETNGHARWLWPNVDWTVVDAAEGPGVDVVEDGRTFTPLVPDGDIVLFCEVAEHFPQWRTIVHNIASNILKSGGLLFFTCAGPGREVHGVNHDDPLQPGWYRNVEAWEVEECFEIAGFRDWHVIENRTAHDIYGWATLT